VTRIGPITRQRRHTLYFLEFASTFRPVFLDTEVDMSAVRRHRADARLDGRRLSWTTYVVHAAGRVLAAHPEANAAIRGGFPPRVARYDAVHAKITLDKMLSGHRVVLSTVLPGVDTASLDELQQRLDVYRDGDPDQMAEFDRVRALHRLPFPLGALAFRLTLRSLRRRTGSMGTLAITSLGHSAVDGFHSVGGTPITLGLGRVLDRPVVRDGQLAIAPVMRLNLAFDHRVIDGAEAADVLTDLKRALEEYGEPLASGLELPDHETDTAEVG